MHFGIVSIEKASGEGSVVDQRYGHKQKDKQNGVEARIMSLADAERMGTLPGYLRKKSSFPRLSGEVVDHLGLKGCRYLKTAAIHGRTGAFGEDQKADIEVGGACCRRG